MTRVTLRNDFHATEITVNVPLDGFLSERVSRKVERALCGIDDCCCDTFSGVQSCKIIETSDGTYRVIV